MNEVKIVAITKPLIEGVNSAEEFVAYCARVSSPTNQLNNDTAAKLLRYCVKHKHWSVFETVNIVMSIKTTRDIGRQILRHRSFSFQEFSTRYAKVDTDSFVLREARMQDDKNRQNSVVTQDKFLHDMWAAQQNDVLIAAQAAYDWAIHMGIAKEQARAVLPEGMTKTHMYMSGSLRSWIHYCELRTGDGTQKEHREVATLCWKEITKEFPSLTDVLERNEEGK
jgi:thymidylate synthase (FAD)